MRESRLAACLQRIIEHDGIPVLPGLVQGDKSSALGNRPGAIIDQERYLAWLHPGRDKQIDAARYTRVRADDFQHNTGRARVIGTLHQHQLAIGSRYRCQGSGVIGQIKVVVIQPVAVFKGARHAFAAAHRATPGCFEYFRLRR